jgi:hypothetical protein
VKTELKQPRPLPSIINYVGKVLKDFHIPLSDYHWLQISDQHDSVAITITDERTDTEDILSFDLCKNSTAYDAIIKILTELKGN